MNDDRDLNAVALVAASILVAAVSVAFAVGCLVGGIIARAVL